jgi:hypothetical protein
LNKAAKTNRNRLMIAGLEKNYTAKQTVLVDGVATLQPQIIAVLQGYSDAADATAAAEAAYHKAVADEAAADAAADATYLSLKDLFLLMNKKTPEVLPDYGLQPVVKQVPTPAVKAAAALKRKATVAARGVVGKRKRAAVTAPAPAVTPPAPTSTTPKS